MNSVRKLKRRFHNRDFVLSQFMHPAKWPWFYGWVVMACAVIGILTSFPGQTIGVSIFTDSLLEVLDLSRVELSAAYMCGTVMSAFLLPRAGRWYDTFGAQLLAIVSAIGLGGTLITLSYIDRIKLAVYQVFNLHPSLLCFVIMIFMFLSLRFFGQGMMTMVSRNMAMKWFLKRRPFVNSLMGMSASLGFSTLAYFVNQFVIEVGWSHAWWYMGLVIAVLLASFFALFYRDNPYTYGLIPDGTSLPETNIKHTGAIQDGASLKEAKKYLDFWSYTLALSFCSLTVTAISFHVVSIFETSGYSRNDAISIFIPVSIISIVGLILGGWLSGNKRLCILLRILCMSQTLCMVGLCQLSSLYGYVFLLTGMGLSQAMFGLLIGLSWPRLFGIAHLGAISGFVLAFTVFGSGMGPVIFSISYSYTDSYLPASMLFLCFSIFLVIRSLKSKI